MSRWFRHYAGMMRDEKLVRVAIKSKQPIERVLWIWGAILESAAEIDDNGRYDLDGAEVAYFLRADANDVDAVFAALEDAGRVAGNCVVHWGDRQFTSDRSKDRQAAYRERKKDKVRHGDGDEQARDGGVTSQSRHGDAPETETETEAETEEEELAPNGACASDDALKPEHVVDEWNKLAGRLGKPRIRDITPERRQLLKARIAQYSIDDFLDVFGKIERSPFLRGDTGWNRCTFDWIFKKANFQKALEGNYDQ